MIQGRKVRLGLREKSAPPVLLVLPARRAHKVCRDLSVHKVRSANAVPLVHQDRKGQLAQQVLPAPPVRKAIRDRQLRFALPRAQTT